MKTREDSRSGPATKEGGSKSGKGSNQQSEPRKKTETRKPSK